MKYDLAVLSSSREDVMLQTQMPNFVILPRTLVDLMTS